MAPPAESMEAPCFLPPLPARHKDFLSYVNSHPDTPMVELLKPYNEYDAVVRKLFAQERSHPALEDNHLNILPLYGPDQTADVRIRARDLASEPDELKEKYIMPLKEEDRKPNGSAAVVKTFKEFQNNFNIFSESSLSDLDWSNIVAAGSSVVTSLLPVPEQYRGSKRGLRRYYHEIFAPASDVDLFLYGLTEEQAIEKIKQIEAKIKDSILYETTTIRTKNAITIASQYPTRHVQIVLRIYKSIAEILTGFDVDCSCAAYDGRQVYLAPRALAAYITQINHIDLTRRSPSYESRLSKYSHRGFEVFWPQLDRSRIDPTIFERSFGRTVGLARLLVLEKLPKLSDRDVYLRQRRLERGRPEKNTRTRRSRQLRGNIKDDWDDEVAEWVEQDDVSDYHTFTIPYGERFHAKKIEKLLYTKDLLLNAEWNKPRDREVNLHRHPAFFGNVEDVIYDCCGSCPKPVTPEEEEVAREEGKVYVSGNITFIKDDPGRQAIGSFHPITETDWTEMAYVGNTSRLCEAIIDNDLKAVEDWLSQEGSDPNRRDHTGRTPLHLACMTSTPEIVQCLIDHGARLISRLADGRTALHLAAARGNVDIVKILLTKSEENEAEEAKKEERIKEERRNAKNNAKEHGEEEEEEGKEDDDELLSHSSDDSDADIASTTTGSFVKIKKQDENKASDDDLPEGTNELEPDVYDINVLAWDNKTSPLHLAILHGHVEVVEELVSSFGADVLLPVKLLNDWNNSPFAAILTLVLALQLPLQKAQEMTAKLLQLGASPAQADLKGLTPLHYFAASTKAELLDVLLQHDEPAVKRAIDHLAVEGTPYNPTARSALTVAIHAKNTIGVLKLLQAGAKPSIEFIDYVKAARLKFDAVNMLSSEDNERLFRERVPQPVILAANFDQPSVALKLLARGVDPNTLTTEGYGARYASYGYMEAKSLLDCVREHLKSLREYKGENLCSIPPEPLNPDDGFYLKGLEDGTYQLWTAKRALKRAREEYDNQRRAHERRVAEAKTRKGLNEKKAAVEALTRDFERLEADLRKRGAKTFSELFPEIQQPNNSQQNEYQPPKPQPFKLSYIFRVPDLTDVRREGYMRLFEAAWCGDLDTIKALTLAMWGSNKDQTPLQIAVYDSDSFSPFSIAVLRGHLDVARAILETVRIQHQQKETKGRERFSMTTSDDADYSNEEGSSDDHGIRIYSEKIDDQFTIDDVGEVAGQVKCEVTPLEVLSANCRACLFIPENKEAFPCGELWEVQPPHPHNLIQYAIWMDNVDLLVFLLDLGRRFVTTSTEESSHTCTVSETDFQFAIQLGRLRCLTELVRRTGAGIRLDQLVEKSGVRVKEKPKFYQGLSVHGKKRADWAAAGRKMQMEQPKDMHPPLLVAALKGSLNSVEWFLSTAPGRHYIEFTTAHKHDKRLRRLAQAEGGVEGALTTWLSSRSNLVLHCAVLSKETDESERLVKYLVQNVPSSLETKSVEGYTPLALAYALHRTRFARILIKAGANQAVRDHNGNNLIHLLLCGPNGQARDKTQDLQTLLDLLDPRLVPSLLTERSSERPGSLTPIAHWMQQLSPYGYHGRHDMDMKLETDNNLEVLRLILDFADHTGQRHLELLDGAGNTPLHDAVRLQLPKMLGLMLDRRPDLLYRENATGSTPADLAEEAWVSEVTSKQPHVPDINQYHYYNEENNPLVRRSPESLLREKSENRRSERRIIWDLCRERAEKDAGRHRRRLVSLFEANEVAKRLAPREHEMTAVAERRRFARKGYLVRDETDKQKDEVSEWYGMAAQW